MGASSVERKDGQRFEVCRAACHSGVHDQYSQANPPCWFQASCTQGDQEIKKFAQDMMKTEDCIIDQGLNKFMWSKGIKNVPYRVRVRISKKRHESEEADEKFYTTVEHVPVAGTYKGLQTLTVDE